jgi:excisionase family DNA binding protein
MSARTSRRWTEEAVRGLSVLVPFDTAADVLGISRSTAYELVKAGEFPVKRVRIGQRSVIRRADLLSFLGIE